MDKEKEIEEMAKYLFNCDACDNIHCTDCTIAETCPERTRARKLSHAGYGNIKQAVSDFAGEVFKALSEFLAKSHITSANEVKQIIRDAEEHYGDIKGKEVYIIISPEGGIAVNMFTGKGIVYADKEQAEKALSSRNEWSKVRGYGKYSLVTLEVKE